MENTPDQPYDHVEWSDERLLARGQDIVRLFQTVNYNQERAEGLVKEWTYIDFERQQREAEQEVPPQPPKRGRRR